MGLFLGGLGVEGALGRESFFQRLLRINRYRYRIIGGAFLRRDIWVVV